MQQPIPVWIGPGGGAPLPERVLRRIGRFADGWFAIVPREHVASTQEAIARHAEDAGRDPAAIGVEGAVGVAAGANAEWLADVEAWEGVGATHLCLRTLGSDLDAAGHLAALRAAREALDAR